MSILSTNQRLIKVGQDYSAGDNIGINDHVISSRNWTPDITYASESAYQRATNYTDTQISALSGKVSAEVSHLSSDIDYISGVALTAHQSLDGYLTKASGDEYYQPIGNYATQDWVSEQGYITGVDLSNYYTKNETSGADELANAFSSLDPQGQSDVNSLVHSNSAEWNNVSSKLDTTSFSDVSSTFLTAIPSQYATTGDLEDLSTSISETYQVKGDYLVRSDSAKFYPMDGNPSGFLTAHQSLDGYATQDWVTAQGYITGVDLSEYAKRTDVLSSIESATSGKLDVSSFASVSSDFLTNEDLNCYATTADLTLKQDTLTFGYDTQNKISSINTSSLACGESEIEFVDYGSQNPTINISGTKPVYCRIPASASLIDFDYRPSSGYFYLPYSECVNIEDTYFVTAFDTDLTLQRNPYWYEKKPFHLQVRYNVIEGEPIWSVSSWSTEVSWDDIQNKPNLSAFQTLSANNARVNNLNAVNATVKDLSATNDINLITTAIGDLNILSGMNLGDRFGYVIPSGDLETTATFASSCILKSDTNIYDYEQSYVGVGFFTPEELEFLNNWFDCQTHMAVSPSTLQTMLSSGTTIEDLLQAGTNTACYNYGPYLGILFNNTKDEEMDFVVSSFNLVANNISVKDTLGKVSANSPLSGDGSNSNPLGIDASAFSSFATTAQISALSAAIGDVESLLSSL